MAETPATTPNPLEDLQKALQWDTFALTPASQKSPGQVFQALLDELSKQGADDTLLTKLRRMGPEKVLSGKVPASILSAIPGGSSTLGQAKAALKGVKAKELSAAIDKTLTVMKDSGEFDEALLNEIRGGVQKLGPDTFSKLPVQQVVRAMSERGDEGRLASVWSRLTGKPPKGTVGPGAGAAASAGPEVAATTRAALSKGGVRGMGPKIGKLGALGAVAGAGFTALQAYDVLGGGREAALQKQTLQGLTSQGRPVTSLDYLRARQQSDERLMERKAVLMKNEPGILEELARTVANSRDRGTLTQSEMSIGAGAGATSRPRVSPTTMLDQLLSELD